ncbi:TPA: hypothetical protein R4193_002831 [Serratia marcescens]|uniref:hypothetical protein n=1 Tax=Serratia marcescens TaxID=615 RepID=UPI001C42D01D|nr:hypothetical protein [Serratia marcescens]EGT0502874.1 hypothetical protein [Serratia marcescens]MDP8630516.1 hypothetical protein [Serratia marcescens]MDP8749348.1 hypothetical protein [Serratia marcescens]MDP8763655.1 hypothetical protein [Serratia marcescens]HBH7056208.1 hypothetical protein [Serratia marcescens]
MPLKEDELIAISKLPVGKIANSDIQPDQPTLHETRNTTDSVYALPYQHTMVDVFGGGAAGSWAMKFQNPLQRVVADLEIFFGDVSLVDTPPNLSALTLTVSGFSAGALFIPATAYDAAAPANFFGLNVAGISPKIKLGGRRRRLEQSGQVIIPLTMILISNTPLGSQESNRALTITLKRTSEAQTSVIPIVSGMIYTNPLPSDRDIALVG